MKKPQTFLYSFAASIGIVLLAACSKVQSTRPSAETEAIQTETQAAAQSESVVERKQVPDATEPQVSPEIAERIATLRALLNTLEESDPSDLPSGPHAERLQDPEIIQEAIEQLKQGEDICTRCLMACGAAD